MNHIKNRKRYSTHRSSRASFRSGCIIVSLLAVAHVRATDTGSVLPNANTADGSGVLISLTTGIWNSGIGFQALNHDTSGSYNTAEGGRALLSNTTGKYNTANGVYALSSNTTGSSSTAVGTDALQKNTASGNTAVGAFAAQSTTTGSVLSAFGFEALKANTTGASVSAFGYHALKFNTTGKWNDAFGGAALRSNTTGEKNCAFGEGALVSNTNGLRNTALGYSALSSNITGNLNNAMGAEALSNTTTGQGNNAIGDLALRFNVDGGGNTAIGDEAGYSVTGDFNVCIGAGESGVAGVSNTTWIRNIYSSTASARAVYVDADHKLGTLSSSRRYKQEIKPMDDASESILALKPVTFRYKPEARTGDAPMFGLIAEEVEQINRDLITYNEKGEVETVRYDVVNAMLLNEFLKEHQRVQEQKKEIADLRSTIAQQRKELEAVLAHLKEQDAKIQRVSDRLELTKPAPEIVANDR